MKTKVNLPNGGYVQASDMPDDRFGTKHLVEAVLFESVIESVVDYPGDDLRYHCTALRVLSRGVSFEFRMFGTDPLLQLHAHLTELLRARELEVGDEA